MNGFFKMVAIYFMRMIMYVFRLFPIKNNRIIINAYRGQQYACNPKYISKKLIEMYPGKYEVIWAFNKPNKFRFLEKEGVRIVNYNSIMRFYYEATAKISINNIGSFSWLPRRKKQEHINTWHGAVDYKKCALGESANDILTKKSLLLSAKETSLFLSANSFFSEICIPKDFGYEGPVLEKGFPRNDILIKNDNVKLRNKFCEKNSISEDSLIVLYAPTWRYNAKETIDPINVQVVRDTFEKKFSRKCVFAYRAHHINSVLRNEASVVNVSEYKDSQEIMLIADVLITDYSSMIWDFSLTKKPVFLYVPDLNYYIKDRGFNLPITEWGVPFAETNKELLKNIIEYNVYEYEKRINESKNKLGNMETGHAAISLCEWIDEKCFPMT